MEDDIDRPLPPLNPSREQQLFNRSSAAVSFGFFHTHRRVHGALIRMIIGISRGLYKIQKQTCEEWIKRRVYPLQRKLQTLARPAKQLMTYVSNQKQAHVINDVIL